MLEPHSRERRAVAIAAEDIRDLPYVRFTQRGRPPRERRSLWVLLALVLAGHLLLGWLAYLILRPSPYRQTEGGVFRVSLVEPASELPPPPPLVSPPPLPGQPAPAVPPRRLHYVPPAPGAISATLQGVKGPPLELYEPNGQIRLPPGTQPKAASVYRVPELKGAPVLTIKSPIKYKPTRFNKDWAPVNESLGAKTVGRAIDKVIEKTTVQKTVKLPGGMKLHCVLSPLALLAGCVPSPPAPPPKNDDDIRLSMPPVETLTGKKVVVPSSATNAPPASASAPSPRSENPLPATASSTP